MLLLEVAVLERMETEKGGARRRKRKALQRSSQHGTLKMASHFVKKRALSKLIQAAQKGFFLVETSGTVVTMFLIYSSSQSKDFSNNRQRFISMNGLWPNTKNLYRGSKWTP